MNPSKSRVCGQLGVVLAAAFVVASCGRSATLEVSWTLKDQNGAVLVCLPGETVQITVGDLVSSASCQAGGASFSDFPVGTFNVVFDLLDSAGNQEDSVTQSLAFSGGHVTSTQVNFGLTVATGSVPFTWSIELNGSGASCLATEVVSFDFAGLTPEPATVSCSAGNMTIADLPSGTYSVTATLLNQATTPATVESTSQPFSVDVPNGGTASTQTVIFVVNSR